MPGPGPSGCCCRSTTKGTTTSPGSRRRCVPRCGIRQRAADAGRDIDLEIISARYRWSTPDATSPRAACTQRTWTDRIDEVLTHRLWGGVVFAAVMFVVFQALFSWSEPAIAFIEDRGGLQQLVGRNCRRAR